MAAIMKQKLVGIIAIGLLTPKIPSKGKPIVVSIGGVISITEAINHQHLLAFIPAKLAHQ